MHAKPPWMGVVVLVLSLYELSHAKRFDTLSLAFLELSSQVALATPVASGVSLAQPRSFAFLSRDEGTLVDGGVGASVRIVFLVLDHRSFKGEELMLCSELLSGELEEEEEGEGEAVGIRRSVLFARSLL